MKDRIDVVITFILILAFIVGKSLGLTWSWWFILIPPALLIISWFVILFGIVIVVIICEKKVGLMSKGE